MLWCLEKMQGKIPDVFVFFFKLYIPSYLFFTWLTNGRVYNSVRLFSLSRDGVHASCGGLEVYFAMEGYIQILFAHDKIAVV